VIPKNYILQESKIDVESFDFYAIIQNRKAVFLFCNFREVTILLYDFLIENYGCGEPIFLSEVSYPAKREVALRQEMSKLVALGLVRRFEQGIYYIPEKGMFSTGRALSVEKVIERKYLFDKNGNRCGYVSGQAFANQFGISTQVPMVITVVSNKATTTERRVRLAGREIILRKPRYNVDEMNFRILQLLDLILDIDIYCEVSYEEGRKRVAQYLQKWLLQFSYMEEYFSYYPIKLFKNLYEMGLLRGVPA